LSIVLAYSLPGQASELEELIHGCLRNERASQEKLYGLFYGRMMSVVRRYIDLPELAEEVLNNGFLRAFQKIGLYKFQGSFEGWLRKIVFHAVCDEVKGKDRQVHNQQVELKETHEFVSGEASDRLEYDQLLVLIQELPLSTRAVFNMYVMEGMTHREIGQLLGISEGTSKWHLCEARKLLRIRIESLELHLNQ
jgi:RNA polymerase sigma-70 factor (ECF subfamily)